MCYKTCYFYNKKFGRFRKIPYLCNVNNKQHKIMDIYKIYFDLIAKKEELEKNNLPVPQELLNEIEEAHMDIIREKVYYDCMIDMMCS